MNNINSSFHRIEHIDIAKGISIMLVALFHSHLTSLIPYIIGPMAIFRLPLFFFLSGIFFSSKENLRTFLWRKFDALLKPYFITSFIILILTAIFLTKAHILLQAIGIFYSTTGTLKLEMLWFLTHLFAIYIFTYFIFKVTKIQEQKTAFKILFIITINFVGAITIHSFLDQNPSVFFNDTNILLKGLPFSLDIVLVTSSFFIAGIFLNKQIRNFSPNITFFILAISTFLLITMFTHTYIDFNHRIYSNPLLATLGAISGIYIVLFLSYYIQYQKLFKSLLILFGKSSLFILILHYPINKFSYSLLNKISATEYTILFSILAYLNSIFFPVIIRYFVSQNRFLSYLYLPLPKNKSKKSESI